jgi:hypothetical protein
MAALAIMTRATRLAFMGTEHGHDVRVAGLAGCCGFLGGDPHDAWVVGQDNSMPFIYIKKTIL